MERLAIGGSAGYRLIGDLDAASYPELRRILRTDLTDGRDVVLDLSAVTFMSSAVLAVLLGGRRLAAAYGTSLRLQAPSEHCLHLLGIAGVKDVFEIDHVVDVERPATGSAPLRMTEGSRSDW